MSYARDFYMTVPCDFVKKSRLFKRNILQDGDYMASFKDGNPQRYFTRVLLPLGKDDADQYRFGVWVEIDKSTMVRLLSMEERSCENEWKSLSFKGYLANEIPTIEKSLGAEVYVRGFNSNMKPIVRGSAYRELDICIRDGASQSCREILKLLAATR